MTEEVDEKNKAGSVKCQEDGIEALKQLRSETKNMTVIQHASVKESSFPLGLLYNKVVEQIRDSEYNREILSQPIKFKIDEAYVGVDQLKRVTIDCDSAPKPRSLELNLAKTQALYDTQVERHNRSENFHKGPPPLNVVEFMNN